MSQTFCDQMASNWFRTPNFLHLPILILSQECHFRTHHMQSLSCCSFCKPGIYGVVFMGHVPLRGLCVFSLECFCFSFFFFFWIFVCLYGFKAFCSWSKRQNYGGCSFSPKALKMTCQFWGSPSLVLVLSRMLSAKTVNSGKKIKS